LLVLVVGGAGYVGSHTAHALRRHGHDVVIYDNLSTGHRFLAQGFELIVGDIADTAKLSPVLRRVDAVVHFAAHAYVGESVENPRKYFRNNVEAALTLLNACADCGVRRMVFSSSCAVYGIPVTIPIAEDAPREPVNPYGASKLFCEHALEAYDRTYGMKFVALRYFNAAGADEGGAIGELHQPETHLIPSTLLTARGERAALELFGTDYPTPDGTCVRDYIHVNDLAVAHGLALQHLAARNVSVGLNLGTGQGYSVKEVLNRVEEVTGRRVPVRVAARRPGDPPSLVADPRRAEKMLQWKAKRSLDDMVRTAWDWMQRWKQRERSA
jgi:UDP-glucose-4-epimerase GalE